MSDFRVVDGTGEWTSPIPGFPQELLDVDTILETGINNRFPQDDM
jgi:hypothetical protein